MDVIKYLPDGLVIQIFIVHLELIYTFIMTKFPCCVLTAMAESECNVGSERVKKESMESMPCRKTMLLILLICTKFGAL